jgi:hypothetical protein
MLETTTTRMNPLIDPQLHVWGWEIRCTSSSAA